MSYAPMYQVSPRETPKQYAVTLFKTAVNFSFAIFYFVDKTNFQVMYVETLIQKGDTLVQNILNLFSIKYTAQMAPKSISFRFVFNRSLYNLINHTYGHPFCKQHYHVCWDVRSRTFISQKFPAKEDMHIGLLLTFFFLLWAETLKGRRIT